VVQTGDLAGFRNWANATHVSELASLWKVDRARIDHGEPPTHAMDIFRLAEQGNLKMLWITAPIPAVSLPELDRARRILSDDRLFVVVQDIFLTESAALADVVLPAVAWGEKTGTFTNADRTVHISDKAVDPPGAARADLNILLDYVRRMDFRDIDGNGSGIQWPCNATYPDRAERLYSAGHFFAQPDYCESYGKDVVTGEPVSPDAYRKKNPTGNAMIKSTPYLRATEVPSAEFPYALVTGRTVYHFHTRTKTARAEQLQAAAPDVWVEISAADADRESIGEGDVLEIYRRRVE
jgi:anaerobic selenocysteine-containing dehydrogenase